MNCPHCDYFDVRRSRRHRIDHLASLTGRWPYRCFRCHERFYATQRSYMPPAQAVLDMHARHVEEKPSAQIVVTAESHVQLDHILMTLNRALTQYQQVSTPSHEHTNAHKLKTI